MVLCCLFFSSVFYDGMPIQWLFGRFSFARFSCLVIGRVVFRFLAAHSFVIFLSLLGRMASLPLPLPFFGRSCRNANCGEWATKNSIRCSSTFLAVSNSLCDAAEFYAILCPCFYRMAICTRVFFSFSFFRFLGARWL